MPKMSSELAASCQRITLHGPTMGTRWSVSVDAEHTVDLTALREDLAAAVEEIDQQMSPWKPDSDLVRLNRAPVDAWVELPAEIGEVLDCALEVHRLSAGAFDPCVGALVDAWGFGAVRDVPDAEAIRVRARDRIERERDRDHAEQRARQHERPGLEAAFARLRSHVGLPW